MSTPPPTPSLRQDPESGKIKDIRVEPFMGGKSSISIGALTKLEETAKTVLLAPLPNGQHSENREPTKEELSPRVKLKHR